MRLTTNDMTSLIMEVVERSYYAQITDATMDHTSTPKTEFYNNFGL